MINTSSQKLEELYMPEDLPFQDICNHLSFTDILDNLDVGVNINDADGNFLFVNMVMVNWRNIPRKEYLKMNVHDFSPTMDSCVFDLVCKEKRRVCRLQYYRNFQQVDSATRMRIVTGTPILDDSGNVQYVVTMLQDVSDFERLYHHLLEEHKILDWSGGPKQQETKTSIVAKSPEFLQMLSLVDSIAPLDSNVLLYGESGSGKEVIARYIHEHSKRKDQPLITVNCASIPESLFEAELFGYEKGSFTGASKEGKVGLVEAANGGTLFLDEVNSLPLSVQGKVLRTIEEKSVQRVGSSQTKKVNFRLIAATNRDLETMVKNGVFREDLYYRLYVIPIIIPPVRNRKADIIPLCLYFLHEICQKYNIKKSFSDEVLDEVYNYPWPGNVREIRNFVERMVAMTPRSVREIKHIPRWMLADNTKVSEALPSESPQILPEPVVKVQGGGITREQVVAALTACGNRRQQAAELLGISRRSLQYKIREYQLSSRCQYDKQE